MLSELILSSITVVNLGTVHHRRKDGENSPAKLGLDYRVILSRAQRKVFRGQRR